MKNFDSFNDFEHIVLNFVDEFKVDHRLESLIRKFSSKPEFKFQLSMKICILFDHIF